MAGQPGTQNDHLLDLNERNLARAILASAKRTTEQQGREVVDTIKTLLRASWAGEDIALLTDTS